jgi:hypothetical protein
MKKIKYITGGDASRKVKKRRPKERERGKHWESIQSGMSGIGGSERNPEKSDGFYSGLIAGKKPRELYE